MKYDARTSYPFSACGLKIYVSETFGSLRIDSLDTLASYFSAWRGPGPIAVHAEDQDLVIGTHGRGAFVLDSKAIQEIKDKK